MIKGDDMINTETNLRKIGEIQSNENQNAVLWDVTLPPTHLKPDLK